MLQLLTLILCIGNNFLNLHYVFLVETIKILNILGSLNYNVADDTENVDVGIVYFN